MTTKKKAQPKPNDASNAVAPAEAAHAKPALIQAAETAKALDALLGSRPTTADATDAGSAAKAVPMETTDTETPPATVAAILDGSIEQKVFKVFQDNPDKEYKVNAVIEELKISNPEINENSIRFTITELKRKSLIHHLRSEGYFQILKFSQPGEAKPFPNPGLLARQGTKAAGKGSAADIASDMAVLREASAVIVKLGILIQRNQGILMQIAKLRSVL